MVKVVMNKLINKFIYAAFTIFLAVTTIFFVVRLTPGDPIETVLGQRASGLEILKLKKQLGMDLPLIIQYKNYLLELTKGNFGKSIIGSKDIKNLLMERMKPTVILAIIAVFCSTLIGIFFGLMAGFNKSNRFDSFARIISLIALSLPIFSLAPLLVLFFSIYLGWFPVSEWGGIQNIFLPVLTLVIPLSAIVMRFTRIKYLEEKHAEWVIVIRAKGLNELQIIWRLLRVCLPSILTIVSIQLSAVMAGAMITETIFDIPGMGSLLFDGIQNRDYPIVQGVIIYSTVTYMIIYFFIDFINEIIDPRLKGE